MPVPRARLDAGGPLKPSEPPRNLTHEAELSPPIYTRSGRRPVLTRGS